MDDSPSICARASPTVFPIAVALKKRSEMRGRELPLRRECHCDAINTPRISHSQTPCLSEVWSESDPAPK